MIHLLRLVEKERYLLNIKDRIIFIKDKEMTKRYHQMGALIED